MTDMLQAETTDCGIVTEGPKMMSRGMQIYRVTLHKGTQYEYLDDTSSEGTYAQSPQPRKNIQRRRMPQQ